jgi:hypothetical protein
MHRQCEIGQIQTIDYDQENGQRPWFVTQPHQAVLQRIAERARDGHIAPIEPSPALAQHECEPTLPPLPAPAIVRWMVGSDH